MSIQERSLIASHVLKLAYWSNKANQIVTWLRGGVY